jgi:hypothetical protein
MAPCQKQDRPEEGNSKQKENRKLCPDTLKLFKAFAHRGQSCKILPLIVLRYAKTTWI